MGAVIRVANESNTDFNGSGTHVERGEHGEASNSMNDEADGRFVDYGFDRVPEKAGKRRVSVVECGAPL